MKRTYLMSKNTSHDDIIVSRENSCDVTGLLSLAHLYVIWSKIDGVASEQEEASFERDPRPHRGLGEDHGHRLPLEGLKSSVA